MLLKKLKYDNPYKNEDFTLGFVLIFWIIFRFKRIIVPLIFEIDKNTNYVIKNKKWFFIYKSNIEIIKYISFKKGKIEGYSEDLTGFYKLTGKYDEFKMNIIKHHKNFKVFYVFHKHQNEYYGVCSKNLNFKAVILSTDNKSKNFENSATVFQRFLEVIHTCYHVYRIFLILFILIEVFYWILLEEMKIKHFNYIFYREETIEFFISMILLISIKLKKHNIVDFLFFYKIFLYVKIIRYLKTPIFNVKNTEYLFLTNYIKFGYCLFFFIYIFFGKVFSLMISDLK